MPARSEDVARFMRDHFSVAMLLVRRRLIDQVEQRFIRKYKPYFNVRDNPDAMNVETVKKLRAFVGENTAKTDEDAPNVELGERASARVAVAAVAQRVGFVTAWAPGWALDGLPESPLRLAPSADRE